MNITNVLIFTYIFIAVLSICTVIASAYSCKCTKQKESFSVGDDSLSLKTLNVTEKLSSSVPIELKNGNTTKIKLNNENGGITADYIETNYVGTKSIDVKNDISLNGVDIKRLIFDEIYPINSICIIAEDKQPKYGKWEPITEKFLLGASNKNDINKTGGSKNHTLTIDELPPHKHKISHRGYRNCGGGDKKVLSLEDIPGDGWNNSGFDCSIEGKAKDINIMNPYVYVRIWKRVKM